MKQMIRSYWGKVLLAIFSAVLLIWGQPSAEASSVKVCGEAATDAGAKEDARRKAVESILLKMQVCDEIRRQITARYADYTSAPEVIAKKKQKGKIYLISNVQVDDTAITRQLREWGKKAQEKQQDLSACFLIRLQGVDDSIRKSQGLRRVMDVCGDTFQRRGFSTSISDELISELLHQEGDYEFFCQGMQQKIQRDYPEITVAVIGEITLQDNKQMMNARNSAIRICTLDALSNANIRIYALDILRKQVIAEYEEAYMARGSNGEEAAMLSLQKATLNAAETLAKEVLNYYHKC